MEDFRKALEGEGVSKSQIPERQGQFLITNPHDESGFGVVNGRLIPLQVI